MGSSQSRRLDEPKFYFNKVHGWKPETPQTASTQKQAKKASESGGNGSRKIVESFVYDNRGSQDKGSKVIKVDKKVEESLTFTVEAALRLSTTEQFKVGSNQLVQGGASLTKEVNMRSTVSETAKQTLSIGVDYTVTVPAKTKTKATLFYNEFDIDKTVEVEYFVPAKDGETQEQLRSRINNCFDANSVGKVVFNWRGNREQRAFVIPLFQWQLVLQPARPPETIRGFEVKIPVRVTGKFLGAETYVAVKHDEKGESVNTVVHRSLTKVLFYQARRLADYAVPSLAVLVVASVMAKRGAFQSSSRQGDLDAKLDELMKFFKIKPKKN